MGLHSAAPTHMDQLGHHLPKRRSRGPLSATDLIDVHLSGSPVSFDPVQNGWVRTDVSDDFDTTYRRPGWPSSGDLSLLDIGVALRPWQLNDAHRFANLLNNPAVWTYLPAKYAGPIGVDAARDLITLSNDARFHTVRAIEFDGDVVGQVRLEYGDQDPELSYWIGQPYWGRGIGSRAVSSFLRTLFEADTALDHVIARVKPENTGSLRILEKSGFLREGRSNAAPDWIILRRDRMT